LEYTPRSRGGYSTEECPRPLRVLVVQKRAGGSIDAVDRPGRFCNSRRTDVGGSYALIAAISGLLPMMFMTRVIL